ncbi:arginine--tRNA ligase [Asanoa ishikariensis]|uniref:Arginine--tRNA ligase n=1 Tax=Asanoa ishikariensis TaxID=137265 RepID=A0A1H3RAC1_9ACTN|nr:arginine--tRNA ligase [Asanoa ishikariensis]GIF64263.1 arginine--tRNA ligase [Asanoa ishikariensis]SDZ22191.1 arginyl-tRNA synthetase [Asanoa ishikariensis]
MTPAKLAEVVLAAAHAVFTGRGLDLSALPQTTAVERPRNPEHGDYASTLALQLAKKTGVPPRELASAIAEQLGRTSGIKSVEIAGPGFLNIRLDAAAAGQLARVVVEAGEAYGHSDRFDGQHVNLEFVSANPTGPVHIGGVRWAAVGDALSRLLRAAGAEVTTEYYFNDAGSQIDRFARSLRAAARDEPTPEDGYRGAYIGEIANTVAKEHPEALTAPEPESLEIFRVAGVNIMFEEIKSSLVDFGVHFDVYFNEKQLHDEGELELALTRLRAEGHIFDADGAVWLRTTDFGDDKDRVLRKSDGDWTYFAGDCAYYLDKRQRGFDRVVIMLGADHHGYIGRMKAMSACFGDNPDHNLEILIGQLVNLVENGEALRMSKRAGTTLTLEDLVDRIGVDAARYALARYSIDSPIDIDVDLWTRSTRDNPVYYVQYVAARTASVGRNAAEVGLTRGAGAEFHPELLDHEKELDLLKSLGDYPAAVTAAAELREPHRVARYLEDLSGAYHRFYDNCRILPRGDEELTDTHRARLWLNDATRTVIANGLGLLGVTAPERM